MNATVESEAALFRDGPFPLFQKSLGLFRPVGLRTSRRAAVVVFIGWVPLVLLVAVQGTQGHEAVLRSFFGDVGVLARSFIAAPLFILAESITLQRLGKVAYHFIHAGLVIDQDRARFSDVVSSTKRLLNSALAQAVAVALAYMIVISLIRYYPINYLPAWYVTVADGDSVRMSWAGWWYALVSLPLLLILFFSWVWRVILWSRFLIFMSRLKLRMMPAHPDRAAGLKFLDNSIYAFMPVAFTMGVVVAGAVANRVLTQQTSQLRVERTLLVLIVLVLFLFVGPLLVFVSNLFLEGRSGILRYGALAHRLGHEFETKWVDHSEQVGEAALEAPDFSATTDLYQIVSNVHEITGLPFDVRSVIGLIVVTVIPFIPVVLLAIPLLVLLKEAAKLLL